MASIRAFYKIPSLKHTFIIVSSLQIESNDEELIEKREKENDYIRELLLKKGSVSNERSHGWRSKCVEEGDFLKILSANLETNSLDHISENLELLAINISKNQLIDTADPHHTSKVLSCVEHEDVIEVFI